MEWVIIPYFLYFFYLVCKLLYAKCFLDLLKEMKLSNTIIFIIWSIFGIGNKRIWLNYKKVLLTYLTFSNALKFATIANFNKSSIFNFYKSL